MIKHKLNKMLSFFIALVWGINGLFCKILNVVSRHQEIVGALLGNTHARLLTVLIGSAEVIMTIWIISGYKSRFNAISQMCIILLMNILEFFLVPELLLWGRFNILFALVFCILIYYNAFVLDTRAH